MPLCNGLFYSPCWNLQHSPTENLQMGRITYVCEWNSLSSLQTFQQQFKREKAKLEKLIRIQQLQKYGSAVTYITHIQKQPPSQINSPANNSPVNYGSIYSSLNRSLQNIPTAYNLIETCTVNERQREETDNTEDVFGLLQSVWAIIQNQKSLHNRYWRIFFLLVLFTKLCSDQTPVSSNPTHSHLPQTELLSTILMERIEYQLFLGGTNLYLVDKFEKEMNRHTHGTPLENTDPLEACQIHVPYVLVFIDLCHCGLCQPELS